MSVTINGSTGVTTPGISNSEGYTGDGLTIAAGAPSGAVQVNTSGNVGIGTSSPQGQLSLGSTAGGLLGLTLDWTGAGGPYQVASFTANRATGEVRIGATNASGTFFPTFYSNNTERARIDSSGNLLVGTTSVISLGKQSISFSGVSQVGCSLQTTTSDGIMMRYLNSSGTIAGNIYMNGTSTAYNTSSDYRLKENIQPMTGALAKVAALKPVIYKWKIDGSDGEGFIAHELAEVVPQCVTGEKDAVDAEGKPVYQGIDTSFLVATLTAAIQELKAQVDAQAAEIAALKGQA